MDNMLEDDDDAVSLEDFFKEYNDTVLLSKFELMRKLRFQLRYDYG